MSYLRVLPWKRKVFVHSSSLYLWRSVFVNDGGRVRVRGGSWKDGNKLSHSECLECNYQFYSRILSCMSVCCDITVGNTGEDGKTVSAWPPTFNSVLSTGQYFVSRAAANWLAPTIRLLRASIRVFQLGLSRVVNHALSVSRSWCLGEQNSVRMLFSVPILTLSWSPRSYQSADTSKISSSTQARSSKVSLFPERSKIYTVQRCRRDFLIGGAQYVIS